MRGYGKIILFGEHAVVYGYPALAASIDVGVLCKITPNKNYQLHVPCESLKIEQDSEHILGKVFNKILSYFPQKKSACCLELHPEIPLGAGLGSSAATSVAIIRGLLQHHNLEWDNLQINEVAFAAEKIFHGTPSGIDNTISTFGGMCYLRDPKKFTAPQQSIREIPLQKLTISLLPKLQTPLQLVVVNTKRERKTKNMVAKVRELRTKNHRKCEDIMQEIASFSQQALHALTEGNIKTIGQLFTRNQECLRELGVSCPEIDFVCNKAQQHNALGAKLTGAGGGGCVVILTQKNPELIATLENNHFQVFTATCG